MPTNTYIPIANITLSSPASSVTFSSITQSYKDLVLVANAGNSGNVYNGLYGRFNSDSGTNYVSMYMLGNGSTTTAGTVSSSVALLGATGDSTSATVINIMNYSTTNKWKNTMSTRSVYASGYSVGFDFCRWANTSAITSINIFDQSGYTFDAGSTFALYGIDG